MMNKMIFKAIVTLSVFGIIVPQISMAKDMNIVYIEASTANRWKIRELPKRIGDESIKIDFYAKYDFDKSDVLGKVLSNRNKKPDSIVLQECSVYFPGPLDKYKEKYKSWIMDIKKKGIKPIIATTVPPAKSQGFLQDSKDFIKEKILGKDSQYEQVLLFNDWLRDLAKEENIELFDLEAALRKNEKDRHMNDIYNSGDGIHINAQAYKKLDTLFYKKITGDTDK